MQIFNSKREAGKSDFVTQNKAREDRHGAKPQNDRYIEGSSESGPEVKKYVEQ